MKITLIGYGKMGREIERILVERGLAPAVENVHVRHGKAVPLAFPGANARQLRRFPGALLPERLCLHGKVRPDPHFSDILSL